MHLLPIKKSPNSIQPNSTNSGHAESEDSNSHQHNEKLPKLNLVPKPPSDPPSARGRNVAASKSTSSSNGIPSFLQFIRRKIRHEQDFSKMEEKKKEERRKRYEQYCEKQHQEQRKNRPAPLKRQLSIHSFVLKKMDRDQEERERDIQQRIIPTPGTKNSSQQESAALKSARRALQEINQDSVFDRLTEQKVVRFRSKSLTSNSVNPLECKEREEYKKLVERTRKPAKLKCNNSAIKYWHDHIRRPNDKVKLDSFHARSRSCDNLVREDSDEDDFAAAPGKRRRGSSVTMKSEEGWEFVYASHDPIPPSSARSESSRLSAHHRLSKAAIGTKINPKIFEGPIDTEKAKQSEEYRKLANLSKISAKKRWSSLRDAVKEGRFTPQKKRSSDAHAHHDGSTETESSHDSAPPAPLFERLSRPRDVGNFRRWKDTFASPKNPLQCKNKEEYKALVSMTRKPIHKPFRVYRATEGMESNKENIPAQKKSVDAYQRPIEVKNAPLQTACKAAPQEDPHKEAVQRFSEMHRSDETLVDVVLKTKKSGVHREAGSSRSCRGPSSLLLR